MPSQSGWSNICVACSPHDANRLLAMVGSKAKIEGSLRDASCSETTQAGKGEGAATMADRVSMINPAHSSQRAAPFIWSSLAKLDCRSPSPRCIGLKSHTRGFGGLQSHTRRLRGKKERRRGGNNVRTMMLTVPQVLPGTRQYTFMSRMSRTQAAQLR